jgi:hypothetical protein
MGKSLDYMEIHRALQKIVEFHVDKQYEKEYKDLCKRASFIKWSAYTYMGMLPSPLGYCP